MPRYFTQDHEWIDVDGNTGTVGITDYAKLPPQARAYLERIAQVTGVPIHLISTSPDRDHTIMVRHPFHD